MGLLKSIFSNSKTPEYDKVIESYFNWRKLLVKEVADVSAAVWAASVRTIESQSADINKLFGCSVLETAEDTAATNGLPEWQILKCILRIESTKSSDTNAIYNLNKSEATFFKNLFLERKLDPNFNVELSMPVLTEIAEFVERYSYFKSRTGDITIQSGSDFITISSHVMAAIDVCKIFRPIDSMVPDVRRKISDMKLFSQIGVANLGSPAIVLFHFLAKDSEGQKKKTVLECQLVTNLITVYFSTYRKGLDEKLVNSFFSKNTDQICKILRKYKISEEQEIDVGFLIDDYLKLNSAG